MKIDPHDVLSTPRVPAGRTCKRCGQIGTIVGLEVYAGKNLHVHRRCDKQGCEWDNGKQWPEVMLWEEYPYDELKEVLKWIDEKKGKNVYMYEGKNRVVGWDGKTLIRIQRLDEKNENNPLDFMSRADYASKRIQEILRKIDERRSNK